MDLPQPSEYWHQCQIFDWRDCNIARYPELKWLSGSINGVKLPVGLAVKCKRAGLARGAPDIELPVCKGGYNGLAIELKREKGGQLKQAQKHWLEMLKAQGRYDCVCHGYRAAIEIIEKYILNELCKPIA